MCFDMGKPDDSAQREALRLQKLEALRAAEAEDDARARDKAEQLADREREAEGRQIQSLALFGATPSLSLANRSLFMPTGGY